MVMKAPLDGGRPATLAKVTGPGFGIAVDATHVYWVTVNAVMRVALAGGSEETLAATGGSGIAIDETSVYFTDHASPGNVSKVPLPIPHRGGHVRGAADGHRRGRDQCVLGEPG